MRRRSTFPLRVGALATAGALALAACGSSGGGTPSQGQIEKKLKKDSTVSQQLAAAHLSSSKLEIAYKCIATAMHKDVDSSDLNDYVNGKKNITDVGGKQKGSAQKFKTDITTCVESKVSGG